MTTISPNDAYNPVTLTPAEVERIRKMANDMFRKYGLKNVTGMVNHLLVQNYMMGKEINQHRTERGLPLLNGYYIKD
jgi:hypothetical protein